MIARYQPSYGTTLYLTLNIVSGSCLLLGQSQEQNLDIYPEQMSISGYDASMQRVRL